MRLAYPVTVPGSTPTCQGKIMALSSDEGSPFLWMHAQGYTGVELLVRDPFQVSYGWLDQELEKSSLSIAAIGTTPMQMEDGLFLIHPLGAIRQEARRRFHGLIQLGARYNAPVLIGKYRGQLCDLIQCSEEALMSCFHELCQEAARYDVSLLVEPQNKAHINNLNTIDEALQWVDRIGYEKLGLLADIYHMSITEVSIDESIARAASKIEMIHMADSDRKTPGEGILPIPEIMKILKNTRFSGYISQEILQKPDSQTACAQTAAFLKPYL